MDLHYRPEPSKRLDRDGCRPSEIARQRPALVTRIQGHESYRDFDAQHTLRGGHYTENEREWPHPEDSAPPKRFVMDEEDRCERMNRELRASGNLQIMGDAE
jgi:hypothetical protein